MGKFGRRSRELGTENIGRITTVQEGESTMYLMGCTVEGVRASKKPSYKDKKANVAPAMVVGFCF